MTDRSIPTVNKIGRWIVADLPLATHGQRIGLLGGSFNPAHDGHLHISNLARARLGLDAVWWLVSPQNPLKGDQAAPLAKRLADARRLAHGGFIKVTGFEQVIGASFTIETVRYLVRRLPTSRFVWIMGADNLEILHQWKAWLRIAATIPLAVIDRPGSGLSAAASPAARRLERFRLEESDALHLVSSPPPAWVLLHGPLSPLSSTTIRAGL